MINLISQSNKQSLRIEYYTRLAVVILNMITGLMLIALLFLIPSIISTFERERLEYSLTQELHERDDFVVHQETTELVRRVRNQLTAIHAMPEVLIFQDRFSPIAQILNEEVRTTSIALNSDAATIRMQGVAPTREQLLTMINRIESESYVESVDVPVSSFLQNVDIPFVITLIYNQDN